MSDDTNQNALILAVIQTILAYGPQAIFVISAAMSTKPDITEADIKALFIEKKPEDYF